MNQKGEETNDFWLFSLPFFFKPCSMQDVMWGRRREGGQVEAGGLVKSKRLAKGKNN